jgi:hypothetical protein
MAVPGACGLARLLDKPVMDRAVVVVLVVRGEMTYDLCASA